MTPHNVLDFWFNTLSPEDWWKKDTKLDAKIKKTFLETLNRAKQGELKGWRRTPHGRLAEIIVLDQFSRNIYRDKPEAFAQDGIAVVLAQEAFQHDAFAALSVTEKPFLILPFMHSESLQIHLDAEPWFKAPGLETTWEFELKHRVIIERFGRYPHRNKILGRKSTKEEIEFLKEDGSSF
jgi:uncharacterized protein (DUF924 family)